MVEDPDSILSTHIVAYSHLTPVSADVVASSGLHGN